MNFKTVLANRDEKTSAEPRLCFAAAGWGERAALSCSLGAPGLCLGWGRAAGLGLRARSSGEPAGLAAGARCPRAAAGGSQVEAAPGSLREPGARRGRLQRLAPGSAEQRPPSPRPFCPFLPPSEAAAPLPGGGRALPGAGGRGAAGAGESRRVPEGPGPGPPRSRPGGGPAEGGLGAGKTRLFHMNVFCPGVPVPLTPPRPSSAPTSGSAE